MTDIQLLKQHRDGSDEAFADVVRRHVGWVYGVARRRLGDAHLAEDVAQAVFILLHRKAPHFSADRAMIGWLHKATWYATEAAARTERRRHRYETEAAKLRPQTVDPSDNPEWAELAPLLDKLIGKLSRPNREAILLRYYRDLSFAEVGAEIGTTPDGARKRVERAVEKLRQLAADQGLAISAISLHASLSSFVRVVPPPGLVATTTVAATAPAGSAIAASSAAIVQGAIVMTASTKLVLTVTAAVAALLVIAGTIATTAWMIAPLTPTVINVPVAPPPARLVIPAGWMPTGSSPQSYRMGADHQVVYSGKASGTIASVSKTIEGYGSLGQVCSAKEYLGKRVRFSGVMKMQNAVSWAGLWFRISDADGKMLGIDNMSGRSIHGTTEWTLCQIVMDIPPQAHEIGYGFLINNTGQVWVDDLKIEIVGSDVPLTAVATVQPIYQAPVRAQNLDFTGGANNQGIPSSWTLTGTSRTSYRAAADRAVVHTGQSSGTIASTVDKIDGFGTLLQECSAQDYLGRRVRFSGFVKSDKVDDSAGLWLRVDGDGGKMLAIDNMADRPIRGTAGWTYYDVVLDVPPQAAVLAFGIVLNGTGQLWVDDLKLDIVGTDVRVTGKPPQSAGNVLLPAHPRNLSFM